MKKCGNPFCVVCESSTTPYFQALSEISLAALSLSYQFQKLQPKAAWSQPVCLLEAWTFLDCVSCWNHGFCFQGVQKYRGEKTLARLELNSWQSPCVLCAPCLTHLLAIATLCPHWECQWLPEMSLPWGEKSLAFSQFSWAKQLCLQCNMLISLFLTPSLCETLCRRDGWLCRSACPKAKQTNEQTKKTAVVLEDADVKILPLD